MKIVTFPGVDLTGQILVMFFQKQLKKTWKTVDHFLTGILLPIYNLSLSKLISDYKIWTGFRSIYTAEELHLQWPIKHECPENGQTPFQFVVNFKTHFDRNLSCQKFHIIKSTL